MTSSICDACGRRFEFAPRRRALRYCSGDCRRSGARKTLERKRSRSSAHIGAGGYRYVLTEQGWRAEHVVLMEQHLGRPLTEHEHVAHRDGRRSNNALSNLELRSARSAPGARRYGA